MERRTFFRAGVLAGLAGAGGTMSLPRWLSASPRRLADGTVRLSSNENPLGISPGARDAIVNGLDDANRYPGNSTRAIREAIAGHHGVETANIQLGAGSTEVLQMFVQLLGRDAVLVTGQPTFEDVGRYAEPFGFRVEPVPLDAHYGHDVGRMREVVQRTRGAAVVYVCNPSNPTGTLTSSRQMDEWIAEAPENVYFLMDEAYFEYVEGVDDYWSSLKWIESHPNVIVARTFSKVHGMAGLRLGYAVAHQEMIGRIGFLASRNNANHLASEAALASLGDERWVRHSVSTNREARRITEATLDELGLDRLPSHTNFLMHRIKGDLETYRNRMQERGWLVGRPFPPMLDYNRVSFGIPEDMERFSETLRDFRRRGWV